MLNVNQLGMLSQLPSPLLTVYLHTSAVEPSLHGLTHEYLPWLKEQSQAVAENLPSAEQQLFLKQLDRVDQFLQQRESHERSIVIFAGSSVWEIVFLRLEVQNEVHWGKPALTQLLWLASEHKPYGIMVIDHAGARFFHYWLGEMVEHEEKKFAIDVSQWKQKELGHVTGQGVAKTRGSQREVFRKRMESQYARLCRETAQHAAALSTSKETAAVFLVGPDELIRPIEAKFPRTFRQPIVLFDQNLARVAPLELLKHVEPQIAAWERRHEAEIVDAVTGDGRATIVGFDETLAELQKGRLRALVLAQGLDTKLHQCIQCGWTDRSADPVCSVCGSTRRAVTLRDVLPELARRHQVEINVVSDKAAERLKGAEGMAGWVRKPKSIGARGGR